MIVITGDDMDRLIPYLSQVVAVEKLDFTNLVNAFKRCMPTFKMSSEVRARCYRLCM